MHYSVTIRDAISDIVNDLSSKKKDKDPRLVKLQLQQYGRRLAALLDRSQNIQSKVPRQITLTDIRWVEDNRAARQAIAEGRLVELCRTQTPVG